MATPTFDARRRRLYALKRAPALRHTSNTLLLRLLELGQEVEWEKDALLCEEGQDTQGFILLLEGELEVRRGGEALLTVRHGTPLGVESLASGRSPFTVRALERSRGLFFPRPRVWSLLEPYVDVRQEPGRPGREEPATHAEVVAFESGVHYAPLSRLIELVAKLIAHDFGDRVLLVRAAPRGTPAEALSTGADGVLRVRLPESAPGRVAPEPVRRLAREHGIHFIFLDGCRVPDAARVDKTVRLVPDEAEAPGVLAPRGRVLPTVVIDPERPPRGSALGARPPQAEGSRLLPACRLRLDVARLAGLPVDGRPLEDVGLSGAERDALARWARALTWRRVGLALSGGGVWGFYHVHILRWLVEQGIPVDFVSSSSMGSLVGAYFCGTALDGRSGLEGLARLEARAMRRQLTLAATAAIVTTYSLERLVERDLGPLCLEELPIRFLPVATNLTSGECVALERGPVALGVRASGSAPGLWAPTMLPPARYVDGAFTSMVPANVLLEAGADVVFASNIFPAGHRRPARAPRTGLGRFLAGLNPVARAMDLVASGVLLLHRSGDSEALLADISYDIPSVEAPLLTAMDFTRAGDILQRAAADEGLARKLEELRQHWHHVRGRHRAGTWQPGGRQAA